MSILSTDSYPHLLRFWPSRDQHLQGQQHWAAGLSHLARPGEVLAQKSQGMLFLAVAVAPMGLAAWCLKVVGSTESGESLLQPLESRALQILHVADLDDWLSLPVKPVLKSANGPLLLQQVGGPLKLPHARIKQGLALSCQQCKDLLKVLQVPFKSNQSRASLLQLILDFYLDTEEEKQEARCKMDAALLPQELQHDDDGSDYEDLLGLVEENANQGEHGLSRIFLHSSWGSRAMQV